MLPYGEFLARKHAVARIFPPFSGLNVILFIYFLATHNELQAE